MADTVKSGGADVAIISKAIKEQNKYTEMMIADGVKFITVEPAYTLPTIDSGILNSMWIDYGDELANEEE